VLLACGAVGALEGGGYWASETNWLRLAARAQVLVLELYY